MGGGVLLGRALGFQKSTLFSLSLSLFCGCVSRSELNYFSSPILPACSCTALCIYKFVNVWRVVLLFTLETS